MKLLLLIVSLVLFFGPLRRPLFGNGRARFSIPALFGFLVCFVAIVVSATMAGVPPQMAILFGVPAAFLFAALFTAEISRWCNRVFGPRQQQRPQRRPRQQPRQ